MSVIDIDSYSGIRAVPPPVSSRIDRRRGPPFPLLQCWTGGVSTSRQAGRQAASRQQRAATNRPGASGRPPRALRHLTPAPPAGKRHNANESSIIGRSGHVGDWSRQNRGRLGGRWGAGGRPAGRRRSPARPAPGSAQPAPGQNQRAAASGRLIEGVRPPDGHPCMKTVADRGHYEKCVG